MPPPQQTVLVKRLKDMKLVLKMRIIHLDYGNIDRRERPQSCEVGYYMTDTIIESYSDMY